MRDSWENGFGYWQPREDSTRYVVEMTKSYIDTALWVGLDWGNPEDEPTQLDENYNETDVSEAAWQQAESECRDFVESAGNLLADWDAGQAGHDFCLTRNGHGAGFWDRGLSAGDALSDLARPSGESNLYVGDDGQLYFE